MEPARSQVGHEPSHRAQNEAITTIRPGSVSAGMGGRLVRTMSGRLESMGRAPMCLAKAVKLLIKLMARGGLPHDDKYGKSGYKCRE